MIAADQATATSSDTSQNGSSPPSLSTFPTTITTAELIIIDWKDLTAETDHDGETWSSSSSSSSIAQSLEQAFGPQGTGIVAIRNVPGFVPAKEAFLPMAHTLAHLPTDYLEQHLTDPQSLYNAGWSHGKEKLGDNTKPDTAKGSFYYNPVTDLPGTEQDRANYPLSYPRNVWPPDDVIPQFRNAACTIGIILQQAVIQLTKHLDALAHARNEHYPPDFLYQAMKDTEKVKARLLYYFPLDHDTNTTVNDDSPNDTWIGWHNDSGFLTALCGDFYVNHDTGDILRHTDGSSSCPDPAAGLYAATRSGVVRVDIPPDCMAVQMGECTQIVTGGLFAATPHCVRGISSTAAGNNNNNNVARISLPCFVDTPPTFPLCMPRDCTRRQVLDASVPSPLVPPLEQRWTHNGMTFGDFLQQTFSLYYDWGNKK